jgi:hypothetical protein
VLEAGEAVRVASPVRSSVIASHALLDEAVIRIGPENVPCTGMSDAGCASTCERPEQASGVGVRAARLGEAKPRLDETRKSSFCRLDEIRRIRLRRWIVLFLHVVTRTSLAAHSPKFTLERWERSPRVTE